MYSNKYNCFVANFIWTSIFFNLGFSFQSQAPLFTFISQNVMCLYVKKRTKIIENWANLSQITTWILVSIGYTPTDMKLIDMHFCILYDSASIQNRNIFFQRKIKKIPSLGISDLWKIPTYFIQIRGMSEDHMTPN